MNGRSRLANRGNFKRAINVLLVVLAFAVLLVALWFGPELQVKHLSQGVARKDVPALVNEYRRTWAQILGGFFVLLGLYFTWRRVEISQKTLETQQDQQVTERFTRAIDQLGATDDDGEPRLEIRLGGIYALERIAWDSPGRDYSTVVEVLTAYVRANAPYPPKGSPDPGAVANEASEQKEPSADIQAILDVLGRREEDRVPEEYRVRPDLRRTDLFRANLTKANLTEANFFRANLIGAYLIRADLKKANFFQADLKRANLRGADLRGADLERTDLERTDLERADLRGAIGITQEQLERALGDATTRLPEGFTRPASWTTGTDEQADGDE